MLRLSDIRIRPKLLFLFILTGIVPLLIGGYLYTNWMEKSLIEESFKKLSTIQTIRKGQIENYFTKSFVDIRLLANSERIYSFMRKISQYGESIDISSLQNFDTESDDYIRLTKEIRKPLQDYARLNGYSNLYLIDANYGHVNFSVNSGDDSGTNLRHGSLKNSALGRIWREVMENSTTVISDFTTYAPAGEREVAFIGHPVMNQSGEKISVVILQFNADLITKIMEARKGMGQTGESYLIGWQDDTERFEFRSNLHTMGDGRYVVGYDLGIQFDSWIDAQKKGLEGGHSIYTDEVDGKKVLVAYNKLKIEGLDWYLISKIERYEVTSELREIYRKVGCVALVLILLIGVCAWFFSRGFIRPIIADITFADAIAKGDFEHQRDIQRKDELGDLARSLSSMAVSLKEIDWLKSGREKLDDQIRGELGPDELAKRCITYFVRHLGSDLGALYLKEGDELKLKASCAFSDREGNFNSFELGEGLVGQAALEGQPLCFSQVEDGAPMFNYGAGQIKPKYFTAIPIENEGKIFGVMLLGASLPMDDLKKQFVDQNIGNIAILFGAAKSRRKISKLLDEAQIQKKELQITNEELEEQTKALRESKAELQSQQEELRVTNEELEEQTKALKESEAELQAQQEELRVTNEELEERSRALELQKNEIWEKNSDLEEAQEIIKKKMNELEVASKYKSEFLANMSHELRTPLNSILILSQLLSNNKDGNLSEKQIESVSAIHSSGAELLNLINEILDLAKVEAGRIDLELEDVTLERIKSELKMMFKEVAASKGVNFDFVIEDELPSAITTDSQRLQQILRNLLTNAFKFTTEGSVTLTISRPAPKLVYQSTLDADNSLAFTVQDEGIGISDEQQKAIFEPFQQADGSTSRKYGGTGLGLSISKELSKLLGGFINLHSVSGEGSTFTVVIPEKLILDESPEKKVVDDKKEVAPLPENKVEELAAPQVDQLEDSGKIEDSAIEDDRKIIKKGSKSLLIIEDDPKFAQILRDFSRERGFLCIIAEDGETGLHFADYFKPSAIVLDIGLPGIDGWTVMQRLKENPKLRHIPVHFISASDNSMNAMRMGAIGYLTKPVSMEKIDETLTRLEGMIEKPMGRLLLVEDDSTQRESIKELIGNSDVKTTAVATGGEAYQELITNEYDCMILDLGLEDMSGFDLLEKIRRNDSISNVPIIVYTGRELTEEEENKLNHYAESIIIKGVKSPERLLDESALFLHRVEEDLPDEKREMLKMVHGKDGVLKGKKVLLVDDDMRNVFALSSVLEERDMEIVIARDGLESLKKLKEVDDINIVLMDIMMPKMDGYEAIHEIRKELKYKKLPIIALTAKAMKGDRMKCIEAGANDYLAKPVDSNKLLSMLRVWLY